MACTRVSVIIAPKCRNNVLQWRISAEAKCKVAVAKNATSASCEHFVKQKRSKIALLYHWQSCNSENLKQKEKHEYFWHHTSRLKICMYACFKKAIAETKRASVKETT